MGVNYGPSHQSIVEVFTNGEQVLARLTLPDAVAASSDAYLLHPNLLDGALQASIGFALQGGVTASADTATTVPFALDELRIFAPCVGEMWVWIRPNAAAPPSEGLQKLDFDLCDAEGRVRVRMKGFTFRPLPSSSRPNGSSSMLLAYPEWREQSVTAVNSTPNYEERHLLVCGVDSLSDEAVRTKLQGVSCERSPSAKDDVAAAFEAASTQVFRLTRELLKKKPTRRVLMQILIPFEGTGILFSGLAGLLRTARLENPLFAGQVIEVDTQVTEDTLLRIVSENAAYPDDVRVRYERGTRHTLHWREFESPNANETLSAPWKSGGVYWITGGIGGLGCIFAEHIAMETQDVTLILTGRSALDAERQQWL
ncbi:MAG: polyketide synthase dehydratase domain-containing protein, partial [Pseudanabaenales cyanobacterium]|nr:polyketide synthase dehydratase domain-containing protein [Pseudanabaenales cyanobacterium]